MTGSIIIQIGKVVAAFGKHFRINHQGLEYEAEIRGKILKDDLMTSPLAVGDGVEFSLDSNNVAAIENILPRKHYLWRPDVHDKDRRQIIAANVDQLVIITSTAKPRFSEGLVDRLLVNAESQYLKAIIVINKIDIAEANQYEQFADAWRGCGYQVIFASAIRGDGVDLLAASLKDKISALTGHSGVGKSSLINAIDSSLDLKTRKISDSTSKGVHTTAAVRMFPLAIGGWVVDTPGLKVMTIAGIDKKILHQNFPEFLDYIDNCRFDNCSHVHEPDCGIKNAVEHSAIAEFRYQSYAKMWNELNKPIAYEE